MRIRTLAAAAAAAVLPLSLALLPPAAADPETTPGGPWPPNGEDNLSSIHGYEELWSTLESIEQRAQGEFELEAAPLTSNTGREIPVVTIGDGPTPIMFIANQHGNEFVVSEGMLNLIRSISGNSAQAREIREELTVTIVPRVNVDGFDADVTDLAGNTTPWRQNFDTDCPAYCEFYATGRGYDINRYHSYSESAYDHPYKPGADTDNPVPEAIAMRLLWDERQPRLVVDFHHQGTYVDEDGRMITGSIMWPNAQEEAERLGIAEEFDETVTDSKRAASQMLLALEQYGWANITRYPSTPFPGIARNAYGLLGSASVLFEVRGGVGQRSGGHLARHAEVAGMAVLESAADGSLWTASTEPADNIRERGPSVPNPHE
jgi:predicted deacylase